MIEDNDRRTIAITANLTVARADLEQALRDSIQFEFQFKATGRLVRSVPFDFVPPQC